MKNAFTPASSASTVGASFVTKRVLDSTSDTIVRLQIWDTAGQERFRSISRLYYRGANACLLCYDITDEASFTEMAGWLLELKESLPDPEKVVVHVVGTKSDVVALDPSKRRVPFERTIAYVAEQLHPSRASTPPPTAGIPEIGFGAHHSCSTLQSADSKRSSGFWGQDIGWDCCHEISAKDGEGIEEVFRVITRKLVEQRNRREEAELRRRAVVPESLAGLDDGQGDKRRSWLGLTPSVVLDGNEAELVDLETQRRRGGRCC